MNNHSHDEFLGLQCFGMGFTLTCPGGLPARGYHGSWLRGVLGRALFQGRCVYAEPRCPTCVLRSSCPYPQVFKPTLLPGRDRVPGFVLHDWRIRAGERQFWFSLVLFGRTVRYAEDWIGYLAAQAGTLDMAGAGPGRLLRVDDLATGKALYDNSSRNSGFRPGARLQPMRLPLPVGESLRVRFLTPLVWTGGTRCWVPCVPGCNAWSTTMETVSGSWTKPPPGAWPRRSCAPR